MTESTPVLHIARHEWPNDVRENPLDLRNLEALGDRLGEQHVIVQSRDGIASTWHEDLVTVYLLRHRGRPSLRSPSFLLTGFIKAKRVLQTRDIAVINASDLWGALLGLVLRRRFQVALLVQLQNDFFAAPAAAFGSRFKRRGMRAVARIVSRRADAIRCLSEGIREKAVAAGVPADRLAVVGTRVDHELFAAGRWDGAGSDLRTRLGAEDRPVVIFVGSLTRRKGVDTLMSAALELVANGAPGTFVFVGEGPLRPELEKQAMRSPDRFTFAGRVSHDDLPAYLAAANVFAFPSLSEGMPRAVLEAMAMECAVVASDIDGVRDLIEHGRTGLLVETADVQALVGALGELVRDQVLSKRLGQAARETVVREHGFDRNMDELAALFRRAVARQANR